MPMGAMAKFKNSYLVRLLVSYILLAVVIIGLFGGILYTRANQMMVKEMSQSSNRSLESIRDFTEKEFLPKFVDTYKTMATVMPEMLKEIAYLIDYPYRDNSYIIPTFNQHLKLASLANPGTKNITFYFLKDDIIIDTNYFYESPDRSPDLPFIEDIQNIPVHQWFFRMSGVDNELEAKQHRVLTYVSTLPQRSVGDQIKGYMYVDVDLAYLDNTLQNILAPQLETLTVLGPDRQLLLGRLPNDEAALQATLNYSQETTSGFEVKEGKDYREVVSYSPQSYSTVGWTYIVKKPMNAFLLSANSFKRDIIQGCIALLVLGVLISLIISQRFYLPVKKIVAYIRKQHGQMLFQTNNEYTMIDSVLHTLDRNLVYQMKTRRLYDLLNGNPYKTTGVRLIPSDAICMVAVVRMEHGYSEEFKRCYEWWPKAFSCDYDILNAKDLAFLLYVRNEELSSIAQVQAHFADFKSVINDELTFSVGIGHVVSAEEGIHQSYKQALHALKYTFLFGGSHIITYEEIAERQSLQDKIPYDQYQNALRAADTEALERFMAEFASAIHRVPLQVEVVEFELMQLISRLSHVIIDLNLHEVAISSSDLLDNFRKTTIDETLEWLQSINLRIAEYLRSRTINPHAAVIHRLKAFIDEHLDEDISLDTLSRQASLSPSYVSSLFGDILSVSFSEYLTNARIERAAELLIGGTRSVTDISTAVGYRNIQYFCRKFKEMYGVTPTQYRNSRGDAAVLLATKA
ncbi:helix-turn-helix domain-containing protein [Paenibacillus sp. LMG 31461]|uniref:Helix-turn-helix domain-containing protein n=2 Tax=Paenibacillus plantarum TaxID=2654975 RepID=A0ABX1XLM3_9BACL|nr:helix-turn-helix domain-containing protein [Paenibacillus plantarum]